MALGGKIVDFCGLYLLQQPVQVARVRDIPVVQEEPAPGDFRIVVDVVDARCVERAAAPDDAVDFVPLLQKEFCKVRSVLTGDAGDESTLGRRGLCEDSG